MEMPLWHNKENKEYISNTSKNIIFWVNAKVHNVVRQPPEEQMQNRKRGIALALFLPVNFAA